MTKPTAKKVSKAVLKTLSGVSTPTITYQLMRLHGLHNTGLRDVMPLDPGLPAFAGPAFTLRYVPLREDLLDQQYMDHKQNLMTPAIEDCPEGAVFLMESGGNRDVGLLGGNIVMRLARRGVAAAVTDGAMRDIAEIRDAGMPVCCTNVASPASMAGLMLVELGSPVSVGGVAIFPGDIIVGDNEGVCAIPQHLASKIAKSGPPQDHMEGWVNDQLSGGAPIKGLYPPDAKARAAYEASSGKQNTRRRLGNCPIFAILCQDRTVKPP
ncbi:MAG: ribonuclease activity regulator RraA [Paracoccaceae bacterium]